MPDEHGEVRRVDWQAVFPFARLMRTPYRALQPQHLGLGLACVLAVYLAGRVLDGLWGARGGVVVSPEEGARNEIEAFAGLGYTEFDAWKRDAVRTQREFARQAALTYAGEGQPDFEARLDKERPETLLKSGEFSKQRDEARAIIDQRLETTRNAVRDDAGLNAEQKDERRWRLERAADVLRARLDRKPLEHFTIEEQSGALATFLSATPPADADTSRKLTRSVGWAESIARVDAARPAGVFISMLR